jgi:uncharacterized protein with GYD domain
MARYIVLMNWTDQGIRNAKDTVKRAKAARQTFEAMGANLRDLYWTVGPYDVVAMVDAPDDETATKAGLVIGMQGSVRTTTLRAFAEQEMENIVNSIP